MSLPTASLRNNKQLANGSVKTHASFFHLLKLRSILNVQQVSRQDGKYTIISSNQPMF